MSGEATAIPAATLPTGIGRKVVGGGGGGGDGLWNCKGSINDTSTGWHDEKEEGGEIGIAYKSRGGASMLRQ